MENKEKEIIIKLLKKNKNSFLIRDIGLFKIKSLFDVISLDTIHFIKVSDTFVYIEQENRLICKNIRGKITYLKREKNLFKRLWKHYLIKNIML